MNALVVDTSSWISYFNGTLTGTIDEALERGQVYLPPVVVGEIFSGKLKASERAQLQSFLSELPLCQSDFAHWTRVGELRAKLTSKGVNMSTPDAQVAQCALDLNCFILSEDRIFSKIAPLTSLKLIKSE